MRNISKVFIISKSLIVYSAIILFFWQDLLRKKKSSDVGLMLLTEIQFAQGTPTQFKVVQSSYRGMTEDI